ncbi:hypothetical protein LKL81_11220 [Bacillus paranthracis]|uniref:hypothetical protein n=1 Tax=Bacillus TaxID=1386 RepID=UPI00027A0EE9|nr:MULTISPECIES: hypothetical protein [Bacillus]EJR13194.1 hypothetical protein II9_04451 [Bacillus cereus MSX-D12]KMP43466.1 hypothetical protein TU55_17640 [Bacillus cereus]KMP69671.1 hypothetical protein TU61_02420 [Bacillus cereus]MCC2427791.1 hypothetical protein [Bacillus paranthracis]MDC7739374.1 hypothetical protein [Bacillus sp. FF-1]
MTSKKSLLERWDITIEELTQIVDDNPSLRGFMMGYVSEAILRRTLAEDSRLKNLKKDDDHDRKKKGDLTFNYKGHEIRLEAKSLQTASAKFENNKWSGTFQCDASDRRKVTLPTGESIETTCLLVGEFDVLAVNLFAFGDQWNYAFALNEELPRSKYRKYPEEFRTHLLSSSAKISLPLEEPFTHDLFTLLDKIVKKKENTLNQKTLEVKVDKK